jgi:cytochrome c1
VAEHRDTIRDLGGERLPPDGLPSRALPGQVRRVDEDAALLLQDGGVSVLAGTAIGSTYAGLFSNDDEEQLAAWLRNPQAEKQGAQMPNLGLSEEQIEALVAYLQSLE